MKETEEETLQRVKNIIALENGYNEGFFNDDPLFDKIVFLYHCERLAQSLPTEEERRQVFKNNSDCYADIWAEEGEVLAMSEEKFLKIFELLTKGEK